MSGQKLFWGLHIECGKAYAQTVNQGFAIKQAVLERLDASPSKNSKGSGDGPVQVFAKYENSDFLLCILSTRQVETSQAQLNVKFETGAQLTLRVDGPPNHQVHLTGYCIPTSKVVSTPNTSAITIPFEGQHKSILVSSKKSLGGEVDGKPKKRVSIEDIVNTSTGKNVTLKSKGNTILSFGDEDEDDEDDDMNFIKNGLNLIKGSDEDEDDDDEDIEIDSDDMDDSDEDENDSDDDGQAYLKMLNQKLGKQAKDPKQKNKKKSKPIDDEDAEDIDIDIGNEDDDDDDDDDDDEDDDDDDEDDDDSDESFNASDILNPKGSQPSTPQSSKIPVKNGHDSPASNKSDNKKPGKRITPTSTPIEPKTPENQKIQALKAPSSAGHTPMKTITKGGVMIQELKVGNGPIAKSGKMVAMYYQGRLKQNNKLFDQNNSGPGFKFRLGKGEVIKGWDIGVEGMKVGGKRKIIIPANLAYGKRGAAPDIPPNSTLVFDLELKNVH